MTITKVSEIKFLRNIVDKETASFSISFDNTPCVALSNAYRYKTDSSGNNISSWEANWREVFAPDTQIVLNCTVELDNGELVSGNFDFEALLIYNKVVRVDEKLTTITK